MRKVLLAIGALLLILLIVVPLSVWLLVDPDDLRARAAAYVKEYTGYELTFGGPVTLSFFPWLGADMRDVAIRQPGHTTGEPFATFEELGVRVRFLPLLRQEVEVGGVSASGGRIRLAPAAGDAPPRELRNFRVTSSGFGTAAANDLSIAMDVTGTGEPLPVALDSRLVLDLQRNLLQLTGLSLNAADMRLSGQVEGRDLQQSPAWDVTLEGDHVDLERLAPLFAVFSEAAPADDTAPAAPVTATIGLQVGHLVAYGLQLSDVVVKAESRKGVLTAKPIQGALYGGQGDLTLVHDGRPREPITRIAGTLKGVNLAPLLADLQQFRALSGQGDVRLNLNARGVEVAQMRRTLSGDLTASIRDGRIEGADFVKMLVQAHAMAAQLRGRPAMASVEPEDATSFSTLAGRTALRNGVATIQELVMESPLFRATGGGTVDLPDETLDVRLEATSRETGTRAVPIAITGTFSEPRYAIQMGEMLKDAAKEELERQIERGLKRLLRRPDGPR